jgi:hypothetical protein
VAASCGGRRRGYIAGEDERQSLVHAGAFALPYDCLAYCSVCMHFPTTGCIYSSKMKLSIVMHTRVHNSSLDPYLVGHNVKSSGHWITVDWAYES